MKDQVQNLKDLLPKVPAKDKGFALSLIQGYEKYGKLSEKQMYWVGELTQRALATNGRTPERQQPVQELLCGFQGVLELFAKAKSHLKNPRIVLKAGDQDVALSLAGPSAKAPGTVNVTDGRPYGQNTWYGRVDQKGWWEHNARLPEESLAAVREVLQELAEAPATTAKKYGQLTGRCCFCNSKLTDEHSTAAGFGPTCADHYGLKDEWKAAQAVLKEAV